MCSGMRLVTSSKPLVSSGQELSHFRGLGEPPPGAGYALVPGLQCPQRQAKGAGGEAQTQGSGWLRCRLTLAGDARRGGLRTLRAHGLHEAPPIDMELDRPAAGREHHGERKTFGGSRQQGSRRATVPDGPRHRGDPTAGSFFPGRAAAVRSGISVGGRTDRTGSPGRRDRSPVAGCDIVGDPDLPSQVTNPRKSSPLAHERGARSSRSREARPRGTHPASSFARCPASERSPVPSRGRRGRQPPRGPLAGSGP